MNLLNRPDIVLLIVLSPGLLRRSPVVRSGAKAQHNYSEFELKSVARELSSLIQRVLFDRIASPQTLRVNKITSNEADEGESRGVRRV